MNTLKTQVESFIRQGKTAIAFDMVLQVCCDPDCSDYEYKKNKRLLLQIILSAGNYSWDVLEKTSDIHSTFMEMLKKGRALGANEFVAACLLRILSESSMDWVENSRWRPWIVSFLDDILDTNVFKRDWKINTQDMGHIVIQSLRSAAQNSIRDYVQAVQTLTSLERIKANRKNLMAVINKPSGKAIFYPFLPPNLRAELGELYTRVEGYKEQKDSWNAFDAYENVKQQAESFIEINENYGTIFSKTLAQEFGNKLLDLIEEDFRSNKAAQPSKISIEPREKKYPFHTIGNEISLGLVVHNQGPGYANSTQLSIMTESELKIQSGAEEISLGRLTPGVRQNIDIPVTVTNTCNSLYVLVSVTWENFDGTTQRTELGFTAEAQEGDIDWDELARSDPYSLEPVTSEDELIGRQDVLDRLIGTFESSKVGSAIIRGQKRVGKTSIARAVESHLMNKGYLVQYLEGGDYVDPDPKKTIARLGKKLCRQLKKIEPRLKHIVLPTFTEALSPLVDFLEDVEEFIPDASIIFILDEFDELPLQLYNRNALGNSFFLTLRSISSRKGIGFLLVGGEKMNQVLSFQGSQLNKWKTISVDYFSREADWSDYKELIQRPVQNSIEFSENSFNSLYETTAGNPYFTNLICTYIFQNASKKRDCYITDDEVNSAISDAIEELSSNTFQHFWDDGIIEIGNQAVQKSIRRRKVLIALSDTLEISYPATAEKIKNHELANDIAGLENELREFINREIMLLDRVSNTFEFKVELFRLWLKTRGVNELIASFPDLDANLRKLQAEETQRIGSSELVELVESWGLYKGQQITEDKVRVWLEQFGKPRQQRMMFKILQNLRFYTNGAIREKMKEVDTIVRRNLVRQYRKGKLKRADILVSYLDSPGKSGAHFARLYADAANIYVDNVVEKNKLAELLAEKSDIQAIVFIDDFVGTGNSAISYLKEINKDLAPFVANSDRKIKFVFASVVAFVKGWQKLQIETDSLDIEVLLHTCETLDQTNQCFSDNAPIFADAGERETARDLAIRFGKQLEKRWPLGYGELELALVFEHGCPNNTLPILWDSSSGNFEWKPLFKRH